MTSVVYIAPVAYLLGGAFFILLIDLFTNKYSKLYTYISYLAIALSFYNPISSYNLITSFKSQAPPIYIFSNAIVVDNIYRFASLLILSALTLIIPFSWQYLDRMKIRAGEYYALIFTAASGMILFVASNDFITLLLSLETFSIALYVLTGITRTSTRSNEASLKYFVIGAFATGFILYGMALLYGASHTIYLNGIAGNLLAQSGGRAITLGLVGTLLLMTGLFFKIGAVPFHMWVPDVYEGAPTAITSFMSVTVKSAGFVVLIRVILSIPGAFIEKDVLWIVAAATMFIGNIFAVAQGSVKRMLAYSSISHTGYALIGVFVACSVKNSEAASAVLYYLFVYTFMTLGAFVFIIYASRNGREAENYDDYAGLARTKPWSTFAMAIFMLSLSGIPPTAGFFAKFYIFKVAIENRFYAIAIIGILTTIISLYYYLKVIVMMYMKEPISTSDVEPYDGVDVTLALAASFTLLFGIMPSLYLEVTRII